MEESMKKPLSADKKRRENKVNFSIVNPNLLLVRNSFGKSLAFCTVQEVGALALVP
jgi:hypothetical protein